MTAVPGGPPRAWAAAEDAAAHTFADRLDERLEIAGPDGHHLQRVRRLRPGEHVTVADGCGSWRRYAVDDAGAGRLRLAAGGPVRVEPELVPRVVLALAPTKSGALDTVAARATELGVSAFLPVRTRRSVVRWDARQAERAVARLRAVVREAAAQSRRARIPEIMAACELDALRDRPGLVVAERGGPPAAELAAPPAGEWTVLVGPEGGLDPAELAALAGAPRLGVGPHVLRAETAPIAVAAVLIARSSAGRAE